MPVFLSVYLNAVRLLAACMVFWFHAGHFAGVTLPVLGDYGGEAVVIFFVLSGFVIAFSADQKHRGGVDYAISRFSRLWSVAIPALLLTCFADLLGQALALGSYAPMQPYGVFKWVASMGVNLLFLNQIWHWSIWPGTNGPFWSLSYEFWYYALFWAAVYLGGSRRWFGLGGLALIAGPKILSAMPIWLLGVWLYRQMQAKATHSPSLPLGLLCSLGSVLLLVMGHYLGLYERLVSLFPALFAWSQGAWLVNFLPYTYLLGLAIALHLWGAALMGHSQILKSLKISWAKRLQYFADCSFALYLCHYPLLYLVRAVWLAAGGEASSASVTYVVLIYSVPFALSFTLAVYCERLKSLMLSGLRSRCL